MVAYNNKKYYIDIIEAKPENAISVIETDCEVDFAPPLDYKEPERVPAPAPVPVVSTSEGMHCLYLVAAACKCLLQYACVVFCFGLLSQFTHRNPFAWP